MASYTTNLNLKKPAGSENVAIGDINNNMDTIDQAYGTLNSKITTSTPSTGITGATAKRSGNVVSLDINVTLTSTGVGWVALDANLPSSLRPLANFYCTLFDDTNGKAIEGMISSASGAISIYFQSAGTYNIRGNIVYCV